MNDKKNVLIVILLVAVIALSFGVVSYSSKDVQRANVSEVKEWDVAITNVEIVKEGDELSSKDKANTISNIINNIQKLFKTFKIFFI